MSIFGFLKESSASQPSVIQSLESATGLEDVLAQSELAPVLLFKHSSSCGVSFFARREVQLLGDDSDPSVFEIVVQKSRDLSNHVADHFGIRHASPQAILVRDRKAVWNASHGGITTDSLRSASVKHTGAPRPTDRPSA
ncbi:MAG: bacillithiol system protein YtxJ [Rhodothermales bacterium]